VRGREGGRAGGRERERGREGERAGEREGGREGGRERWGEGGARRERSAIYRSNKYCRNCSRKECAYAHGRTYARAQDHYTRARAHTHTHTHTHLFKSL
jgi:hypothetical protein